jgi:hypothetical protein
MTKGPATGEGCGPIEREALCLYKAECKRTALGAFQHAISDQVQENAIQALILHIGKFTMQEWA